MQSPTFLMPHFAIDMPYPDDENQIASSIRQRMEVLRGESGYRIAFSNCSRFGAIEEDAIEDDEEEEKENLEGSPERRRQSCNACHGKCSPPSEGKTTRRVKGIHPRGSEDGDDPKHRGE